MAAALAVIRDRLLAIPNRVCAGGADTVPIPGDAYRWNKPLAARLLPAYGKRVGDSTQFANGILTGVAPFTTIAW
jgi:hypothetical protein